jgi:hypothetical protein
MDHKLIRKVAIYPAIGIARIGNSTEFYLASEIPGRCPVPTGGFKDGNKLLKKQVPIFRVYAFDEFGETMGEVNTETDGLDVEIEWRVHVANRKAAWYQFNNALDLGPNAIYSTFRNENIVGVDRQKLVIDPGMLRISGRNKSGEKYHLKGGKFFESDVTLGEIRTDGFGRLMFFGGSGVSKSADGSKALTFANNDGWHDDVSDGTVRAKVTINGNSFEAAPSVAVCTPPNFGPGLFSIVTMYDVVYDLYLRNGWLHAPAKVNFRNDIMPILTRLSDAQWVNFGFYILFGANSPSNFSDQNYLRKLGNPAEEYKSERYRVFAWFRNKSNLSYEPNMIPPYYGDLYGDATVLNGVDLSVTETQYKFLQQWAEGNFIEGEIQEDVNFNDLTPRAQISALLKAPLEECLGGPFHPGIELTWIFRNLMIWDEPFRLKLLPEEVEVSDDYGPMLITSIALAPRGPIDGSGPGSITRWMGVPWQTDSSSCLSGYDPTLYLPLPSFWAARVPNHVLSMDAFMRASDKSLNMAQRHKHFSYRVDWLRDLNPSYVEKINGMIDNWHRLGVICKQKETSTNESLMFPASWWIETDRNQPSGVDPSYVQVMYAENAAGLSKIQERGDSETRQSIPLKRFEL